MNNQTLRRKRAQLEWTQKRLAQEVGVDPQTISYWETEHVKKIPKPMVKLLEKIFREHGV